MEETHDQVVIRLLTLLANSIEPISTDETWSISDIAIFAELASGGFISAGDIVRDGRGQIVVIVCASINPSGRNYLAELQKQLAANTSLGFIKEHRLGFYKWFFGIVGTIIAGLVLWHLTHEDTTVKEDNHQQTGIALIKNYNSEYENMTKKRASAAVAILEFLSKGNWSSVTNNTDGLDDVLGFFDALGYGLEKKQLDSDTVYEYFCDGILSYYQGSRGYIDKIHTADPTALVHLTPLYESMRTAAANQPPKVNSSEIYFTKQELIKFFQSETNSVNLKEEK